MPQGFGIYKNVTPHPVHVNLPANDIAALMPGRTAMFADSWAGVVEKVRKGEIVRVSDAGSASEPLVVVDKD